MNGTLDCSPPSRKRSLTTLRRRLGHFEIGTAYPVDLGLSFRVAEQGLDVGIVLNNVGGRKCDPRNNGHGLTGLGPRCVDIGGLMRVCNDASE